ncbi:MAG TPA: biopolymer transporter ExbD [Methylomirabilota bacterium]|nr:biopolymer transporter ExbD [Methylomirabilota bacterium]
MKLTHRPPKKARIEIIPMINTVFFLLVFFMMASLSMTVYRGMSLSLPKAASGEPRQDRVSVSVTRDGVIYLDRTQVEPAQLTEKLRALHEKDPEVVVVVSADGDVTHRRVVEAMDAARLAGISKMAIAVQPLEKK